MCDRLGVSVWEVVDAAATKPFGFMPFYPGPGLGGHCIPIDPFYLSWKVKEVGFEARFIELAGHVNGAMPHHVVDKVADALNHHSKSVRGSSVLVLGISYKRDIDDVRESPALDVMAALHLKGATPHLPRSLPARAAGARLAGRIRHALGAAHRRDARGRRLRRHHHGPSRLRLRRHRQERAARRRHAQRDQDSRTRTSSSSARRRRTRRAGREPRSARTRSRVSFFKNATAPSVPRGSRRRLSYRGPETPCSPSRSHPSNR